MNPDFQKWLEKLDDKMDGMLVTQAEMKRDIAYHIRRTDLAEESISLLRDDIKPIQKHVTKVQGVLAGLGGVSLIIGIIAGVLKIMENF